MDDDEVFTNITILVQNNIWFPRLLALINRLYQWKENCLRWWSSIYKSCLSRGGIMRSKVVLVSVHRTCVVFAVSAFSPSIGLTSIVRGLACRSKMMYQENRGRSPSQETCTRLGRGLERRMWLADWVELDRESRTCMRIVCRGSSTWCFCRSNIAVLDLVYHSSCSACSSSLPSAAQLHRGRLTWIRRSFLPTWWNESSWDRIEVREGIATVEFVHCPRSYRL